MQYIIREAAKISALTSRKIDKNKYVIVKEILPFDQSRIIKQTNFAYSPLGKAFEKQTKMIEDQEGKQVTALEERGKQLVKYCDEKRFSTFKTKRNYGRTCWQKNGRNVRFM